MAKFYTKEQMDGLATIIGDKIKTAAVTAATETVSFISALDAAIGSTVSELMGNSIVIIGNQSGGIFRNYRMTIDGEVYNENEDDLESIFSDITFEEGSKGMDLAFGIDSESNGLRFLNWGSRPMTIKLESTLGTPMNVNEFLQGNGNSNAEGTMFEFLLLPEDDMPRLEDSEMAE